MKGTFFIHKQKSISKLTQEAEAYNAQFYTRNSDGERKVVRDGSRLLKKAHLDILDIVIYLLIRQNRPGEPTDLDDLTEVTTSRAEILNLYSQRLNEKDPFRPFNPSLVTVWRHIRRLVDAGLLEKRNIGGIKNFRLKVPSKFLEIIDLENNEPIFQENPSQSAICPEKRSKCKLILTETNREKEKNNTASVDNMESGYKPDDFKKTENTTKTGNTGEVVKNQDRESGAPESFFAQMERIKKLGETAEKRHERLAFQFEARKYNTVVELYKEIMGLVFTPSRVKFSTYGEVVGHHFIFRHKLPKLNHFEEHGNALKILLTYFAKANNDNELGIISRRLYKSAELARRTILRKGYNIDYLTPTRFLRKGRFSLANVHDKWLPEYLKRESQRIRKLEEDQKDLELIRKRTQFRFDADLLLTEVLGGASIAPVSRYISTFYGATFQNWFLELLEKAVVGEYRPRSIRHTKEHKDFLLRVFDPEGYITQYQDEYLGKLDRHIRQRNSYYGNTLASALKFKDPQVRHTPVAVRDPKTFNGFVYKHLLFPKHQKQPVTGVKN